MIWNLDGSRESIRDNARVLCARRMDVENVVTYLSRTDAPNHLPCETVDVRDVPPERSRRRTLDQLADVDDTVVVQIDDRRPAELRPDLAERGYQWQSLDAGEHVVTVIWKQ